LKRLIPLIAAALIACPAPGMAADADKGAHPLLDLAREREQERARVQGSSGFGGNSGLSEALHQREQGRVPADEECAHTMGASRFANLHIEVAVARTVEGDYAGAASDYRRAHACRPRDPDILAALAGVLFDARDFRGAREALNASLAIDPRAITTNRLAGNLDFVEQRWADATARFRYVAASDEDRVQAAYGQLMYWLSQRRAGVAKPELVARTPGEGWPQPVLQFMRGEIDEAGLIEPIRDGDSDSNTQANTSTDERLCEALYYVGEEYWARGKPDVARDYFAALVNIKVLYFLEHGLALAEIAKLRK
jgi:lipoprotein NlpI